MYFQPIKNEDPRLDFYTVYKRETTEYDTERVRKYNEELNITLIFVRFHSPPVERDAYHIRRPVYSPQSVPVLSSMSIRNSSRIQASGQKPTSVQSFSASTDPSRPTSTLQLLPHGTDLLRKS